MTVIIPNNEEKYFDYINRILQSRSNEKDLNNYQELHHIIPKGIDGNDDPQNLIWLYAKEHFYAHKLLANENQKNKSLVTAYWMMAHCGGKRKDELNPEDYEDARTLFRRNASGKNNPNYGKKIPEYVRKKMSESQIGKKRSLSTRKKISESKKGEKHPLYGKHLSEETRKKMSESKIGEKNHMFGKHLSEETKKKLSESHKRASLSEETLQKMRESQKGNNVGEKNPRARSARCIETGIIFKTVTEAARYANTYKTTISSQINGKFKNAGKHPDTGIPLHWEYVLENNAVYSANIIQEN